MTTEIKIKIVDDDGYTTTVSHESPEPATCEKLGEKVSECLYSIKRVIAGTPLYVLAHAFMDYAQFNIDSELTEHESKIYDLCEAMVEERKTRLAAIRERGRK